MKNSDNGYYYGNYWTCRIVATSVYSIGACNLTVGGTKTLSAVMMPETATSQITYASSNEEVVTVDETGKVTAVGNGSATITVEAGGSTTAVDVIVGNKIYALNVSTCSSSWRCTDSSYQITSNGVTWLNSGRFYRTSWYNINAIFSEYGTLENITEIPGVSKVMISYYWDYTNEQYRRIEEYWCRLCVGNSRDSLETQANRNQEYVIFEKTSYKDYENRNLLKYTVTYDIPEGCSFFKFGFEDWSTRIIQEIAFF